MDNVIVNVGIHQAMLTAALLHAPAAVLLTCFAVYSDDGILHNVVNTE